MTKPKVVSNNDTENLTASTTVSFTPFVDQLIAQYKTGMAMRKNVAREMRAIKTILQSNGVDIVAVLKQVKS